MSAEASAKAEGDKRKSLHPLVRCLLRPSTSPSASLGVVSIVEQLRATADRARTRTEPGPSNNDALHRRFEQGRRMRERRTIWPVIAVGLLAYCGLYLAARASHLLIERHDVWNFGRGRGGGMTRSISPGFYLEGTAGLHRLACVSHFVFYPLCKLEERGRSILFPLAGERNANEWLRQREEVRDAVDSLNDTDDLTEDVTGSPGV